MTLAPVHPSRPGHRSGRRVSPTMTSDELRAWRSRNFGEGYGSRTLASAVLGVSRWTEWRFERGDRPIPPSVAHLAYAYEASPEERQLLESLARLWAVQGRRPLAEERSVTDAFTRLRRARLTAPLRS